MSCATARTHLQTLTTLRTQCVRAHEGGNYAQARSLMRRLEAERTALESLLDPLASVLNEMHAPSLKEQYRAQYTTLTALDLLETLSSGDEGIKDEQGNEYPLPSYHEVARAIRKERDTLTRKVEQGFTRFQITPFALPLDTLTERTKALLKEKHAAGTLKGKDGTTLTLDTANPLYVYEQYADLRYLPEWHTEEGKSVATGGRTKEEMIQTYGGFHLSFTEDTPITADKDKGTTTKGRRQIEGGQLASEQYALLQTPQYQNETGYTPQEWLMHVLDRLSTTGTVLDDDERTPRYARLPGARFTHAGAVPVGCFHRAYARAFLGRGVPWNRNGDAGCRLSVRVGL